MAVLAVNTVNRTGADPVNTWLTACAAGGDSFPCTGKEFALFQNTGGGNITVTEVFGPNAAVDGQTPAARTFVVNATTGYMICGPWNTTLYNDVNSRMNFTYSGVTGLKVAILILTTS
jgi:hypothetical protein